MPRVYISTPTYSASPDVGYVNSVLANLMDLTARGIVPDIDLHQAACYLDLARCYAQTKFMESEPKPDYLLFWDDDVAPEPTDAVARLIAHDVDVVAGVYPMKLAERRFPWRQLRGSTRQPNGLIEAEGLPTGFMLIKRSVFDRMIEAYPNRWMVDPMTGKKHWHFFPTGVLDDHVWWGEDYQFCKLARAIGIRIWADPDITFRHAGRNVWKDNLSQYMTEKRRADIHEITVADFPKPVRAFA